MSPLAVLTKTGTKVATVTTSRRGRVDVESNIVLKIGANTTIGMVAAAAASGVIISSATRNRATSEAAMTARTVPINSPTSALEPVFLAAVRMRSKLSCRAV